MAQAGVRMSAVHMHLLAVQILLMRRYFTWRIRYTAMPMSAVNDRCLAKIMCNGQILRE